jgi:hypothetical protein
MNPEEKPLGVERARSSSQIVLLKASLGVDALCVEKSQSANS